MLDQNLFKTIIISFLLIKDLPVEKINCYLIFLTTNFNLRIFMEHFINQVIEVFVVLLPVRTILNIESNFVIVN